jgi:hypothetical protein
MAAKKKAAKKKAAKATTEKVRYGSDIKMSISAKENPRREGSAGHGKFKAMSAYVSKNKGSTLADVIANTDYKAKDYAWDKERGHVK